VWILLAIGIFVPLIVLASNNQTNTKISTKTKTEAPGIATMPTSTKELVKTQNIESVPQRREKLEQSVAVKSVDTTDAKSFIYFHESGNDPTKYNSSGCLGLGQACPASKLLQVCPTMDYACEDSWFTNYMVNRYGTWENAKTFWLNNNWW